MVAGAAVVPAGAHHPAVVAAFQVALLRLGQRRLVPRVALVDRVAERVVGDERLLGLPVVVVGAAEQDADAEVDVDQARGEQFAVEHDAGRDEHLAAPGGHVPVVVVDGGGVLEGAPAAEHHPAPADLLVAGQRLVEEVEEVVVHRDGLLDEVEHAQQPGQVVGEHLGCRDGADAARIERGRVHVAPLHQAAHLPGDPADLQRLAVDVALEGVERAHDVGDRAVAVDAGVRRLGGLGAPQQARVGLLDHLLTVVDEDQVVLEERVVEHVLGGLAEVDDPLGQRRRFDAVRHVLRVDRAGRVVVTADAADAAGDEVRVARILALHEHAVAAEQRRGAPAFDHLAVVEVDLRVDAEVADDPGDRVPGHLDQFALGTLRLAASRGTGCHLAVPPSCPSGGRTRWSACARCAATSAPCWPSGW